MTKYEWESELKKNIHRLPDDEIKRVLEYYGELFEDNIERGKSESVIINEFGNPVDVAYRIMSEYDGELKPDVFDTPPMRREKPAVFDTPFDEPPRTEHVSVDSPRTESKRSEASTATVERGFNITGRQIGLIVFIVINVVTGFAPVIVAMSVWIVLGALTVAGAAVAVGGVAAAIVSVGVLFTGVASGLAQLGIAIAIVGVGIVITLIVIRIMKIYGRLTVKFFKLFGNKE